jgi:ubiquinone biosynthesis protein
MLHPGTIRLLERDARRVAEIVGVLAKYGLADRLEAIPLTAVRDRLRTLEGQPVVDLSTAERLRIALTELGTTFIKLGQMLSTRPDVIGAELAHELSRLQTDTVPDPLEAVRKVVEEDLGRPPEALFAEFEALPFASASIAQVHRATLPDGQPVVVKIQKSDVRRQVESDLSILMGLAELAQQHIEELRPYEPVGLARQFQRVLLRELDFTLERRNLEEFAASFADDPGVRFPRAWPDFSSRRVLTMERFDGVLGTDTAKLQAANVDLNDFARRGAQMYLEMIFRDSFYHADPHPGNLMVLPGGVIGVLDCGMVGRLDDKLRGDIEQLLLSVAQHDPDSLTDAVCAIGKVPRNMPRDQLQADVADFVGEYTRSAISELDLGAALRSLTGIVRRYRISLPPAASLLLRTLIELEGTAQIFSPHFSLAEVVQPFYTHAIGRRLSPHRILVSLQRSYRDWEQLLRALPGGLSESLQRLREGKLSVQLEHRHLDPVVNRLVLGLLTAALFLGSSLLWSMQAPPLVWGISVFGAAGYLLALYLGVKVLRAVKQSGDVRSRDDLK